MCTTHVMLIPHLQLVVGEVETENDLNSIIMAVMGCIFKNISYVKHLV